MGSTKYLGAVVAASLATAIVLALAAIAHAETPSCTSCSSLGWLLVVALLGAMAGGSITFVAAALFAAGSRADG